MPLGKHRGAPFHEILATDHDYLRYMAFAARDWASPDLLYSIRKAVAHVVLPPPAL